VCDNNILVVDGHSTDDTTFLASQFKNVDVIYDNGKGKGDALRVAFDHCKPDNVVFVDVDGTYEISKIGEFMDALDYGYDVVTGTRNYEKDAEPHVLGVGIFKLGDRLWSIAFMFLYGMYIDNLSGYRGLSRRVMDRMELQEDGWGIETEISCKTINGLFTHKEIQTRYFKRIGNPKPDFSLFSKDTFDLIKAFLKHRFWRPT
jgi:dolichol-phosphate mannosyltransferase